MTELHYPLRTLTGDYVRAAIGLAISIAVIVGAPGAVYVMGPIGAIFAVFALRTLQRQLTRIEVSPEGISLFFVRRVNLAWRDVRAVQLNYYSTKRDRTGGWMQLTIKAEGPDNAHRRIRVDSRLDGFDTVARCAADAARTARLSLSSPTIANFMALGVDLSALEAPEQR